MKRYLIVENNVAINDTIANDDFIPESNWIEVPLVSETSLGIGWTFKNNEWIEPEQIIQSNSIISEPSKDELLLKIQELENQIQNLK